MPDPALRATERFKQAVALALDWHQGQFRKGSRGPKIPYSSHLFQVAGLVLEHGGDTDQAIAGLLHDSLEDAPAGERPSREASLAESFGERVLCIVRGCTDTRENESFANKREWRERKENYLEHLRCATGDVLLVSACDKRHNLGALVGDLRTHGAGYLDDFNAGPSEQLWYYEGVRDAFSGKIPERLEAEIEVLLFQFRELIPSDPEATLDQAPLKRAEGLPDKTDSASGTDKGTRPGSKVGVVYGEVEDSGLVLMPEKRARNLAQLWRALESSSNWGKLRERVSGDVWARIEGAINSRREQMDEAIQGYLRRGYSESEARSDAVADVEYGEPSHLPLEIPADSEPLVRNQKLAISALIDLPPDCGAYYDWLPGPIATGFGQSRSGWDYEGLEFNAADVDALVLALYRSGFVCRSDQELIDAACNRWC